VTNVKANGHVQESEQSNENSDTTNHVKAIDVVTSAIPEVKKTNEKKVDNQEEDTNQTETKDSSQMVTPWVATCSKAFDYDRLLQTFGLKSVDTALLERFEKVTGKKPHPWLGNRQIFFAHQDLDRVLDYYEQKKTHISLYGSWAK